MYKKNSIENILKKGVFILPFFLYSQQSNSLSLHWERPDSRQNDEIMTQEDLKGYLVHKNINNNGWHLDSFIGQNSSYTSDGEKFKFPLSPLPKGSTAEYRIIAEDTEGLVSNPSNVVKVSASDFGYSTPPISNDETPIQEDSFLIDLSKAPKETYGDFSYENNTSLEIDSLNNSRDGFFYQFNRNNFGESRIIQYEIDSNYSGVISFQVLSGNHWYNHSITLQEGENNGSISLDQFKNQNLSNSSSARSLESSLNSFALSGEDNQIKIKELIFKK